MADYTSYLEPFHSGSFIAHACRESEHTLCGLHISTLTRHDRAGASISTIACPRCLAFVEANDMPRLASQQMDLMMEEGQDGK